MHNTLDMLVMCVLKSTTVRVTFILATHSRAISGTSGNGETYQYYIGVCVNPRPGLGKDDDCMVIQYNKTDGKSHCLGTKNNAQVTETYGELCVSTSLIYTLDLRMHNYKHARTHTHIY